MAAPRRRPSPRKASSVAVTPVEVLAVRHLPGRRRWVDSVATRDAGVNPAPCRVRPLRSDPGLGAWRLPDTARGRPSTADRLPVGSQNQLTTNLERQSSCCRDPRPEPTCSGRKIGWRSSFCTSCGWDPTAGRSWSADARGADRHLPAAVPRALAPAPLCERVVDLIVPATETRGEAGPPARTIQPETNRGPATP
jgi:hypothetical protein